MFNIQDAIAAAVETGPDMNEAVRGGGGDYTPPAAGPVRLRLVAYIELGVHDVKGNPAKGIKDKSNELVTLGFECSGPKHPPREVDGVKYPQLIWLRNVNLSLNEKAGFFKLFKRLNHTGEYKHFAQMLGKPFMGTIVHNEVGEGAAKKVYANLKDDAGFTIRPPYFETMDAEGNMVSQMVPIEPALSPLKCFLWNAQAGLKEMWDSIFIDGMTDEVKDDSGKVTREAQSKNYYQNTIKAAKNFAGSPIAELLFAGGEPDLGAAGATAPARTEANKQATADAKAGAAADPLAAI